MTTRKAILCAGLGPNTSHHPPGLAEANGIDPTKIGEMVRNDIAAAKAAGFDIESYFANPYDPATTTMEFLDKLRTKKWDGVMIGFGVRGNTDFTALFEDMVNGANDAVPGLKFGFSPSPDSIFATAKRMFPAVQL